MLNKYSPMDVLEHLSRVQMLSVDGQWIMTEKLKKTREIMAQLKSLLFKIDGRNQM